MQKIKKQKSFESSYRPVVIWLEDLAELFAVMKENAEEVGVTTDDYRFGTIEELKEHFGSQTQFQLRIVDSSQRFAYIEFTRRAVHECL
jgi:flagellar biosynthesis GTPase FlhF